MALHQTLKNCNQCGHAAELHVVVCPKCMTVFDKSSSQLPESAAPVETDLSPAEILARMEAEKSASRKDTEKVHAEHTHERTMSQAQADAISVEKEMFNKRFKELLGKKDT